MAEKTHQLNNAQTRKHASRETRLQINASAEKNKDDILFEKKHLTNYTTMHWQKNTSAEQRANTKTRKLRNAPANKRVGRGKRS